MKVQDLQPLISADKDITGQLSHEQIERAFSLETYLEMSMRFFSECLDEITEPRAVASGLILRY